MNDQTPQTPHQPIMNEDGHTMHDLLPTFPIQNLVGYCEEIEVIGVLDAHDEDTIAAIDELLGTIEAAAIELHRLDPTRHSIWLAAITTIAENSRDLLDD